MLIHYLRGNVTIDDNQRVVYPDGTTGSHILDLIRYYVYPSTLKLSRPLDAIEFGMLLKGIGVPTASIGRDLVLNREPHEVITQHTAKRAPKRPLWSCQGTKTKVEPFVKQCHVNCRLLFCLCK